MGVLRRAGALRGTGEGFSPTGVVVQLLHFDTADPDATDAECLGTETLIRADVFLRRGPDRPCPRGAEGPTWFPIDFGPLGVYYACHQR